MADNATRRSKGQQGVLIFGVIKSLFQLSSWATKALYAPKTDGDGTPGTFLLQGLDWWHKIHSTSIVLHQVIDIMIIQGLHLPHNPLPGRYVSTPQQSHSRPTTQFRHAVADFTLFTSCCLRMLYDFIPHVAEIVPHEISALGLCLPITT